MRHTLGRRTSHDLRHIATAITFRNGLSQGQDTNRQTLGNMHSREIKITKPTALDSWDLRPLEAQDLEVLEAPQSPHCDSET